mgnify:CR=1 FL=1
MFPKLLRDSFGGGSGTQWEKTVHDFPEFAPLVAPVNVVEVFPVYVICSEPINIVPEVGNALVFDIGIVVALLLFIISLIPLEIKGQLQK